MRPELRTCRHASHSIPRRLSDPLPYATNGGAAPRWRTQQEATAGYPRCGPPEPAIALLIFVAALAYFNSTLHLTLELRDEGFLLYNIARVADGEIPHRDFIEVYGPGVYAVTAPIFEIFGDRVLPHQGASGRLSGRGRGLVLPDRSPLRSAAVRPARRVRRGGVLGAGDLVAQHPLRGVVHDPALHALARAPAARPIAGQPQRLRLVGDRVRGRPHVQMDPRRHERLRDGPGDLRERDAARAFAGEPENPPSPRPPRLGAGGCGDRRPLSLHADSVRLPASPRAHSRAARAGRRPFRAFRRRPIRVHPRRPPRRELLRRLPRRPGPGGRPLPLVGRSWEISSTTRSTGRCTIATTTNRSPCPPSTASCSCSASSRGSRPALAFLRRSRRVAIALVALGALLAPAGYRAIEARGNISMALEHLMLQLPAITAFATLALLATSLARSRPLESGTAARRLDRRALLSGDDELPDLPARPRTT